MVRTLSKDKTVCVEVLFQLFRNLHIVFEMPLPIVGLDGARISALYESLPNLNNVERPCADLDANCGELPRLYDQEARQTT